MKILTLTAVMSVCAAAAVPGFQELPRSGGSQEFIFSGSSYRAVVNETGLAIQPGVPGCSGLRLRWHGARANVRAEAVGSGTSTTNFLLGQNPDRWRTRVPSFSQLRYRGIYPGIDLIVRSAGSDLEYDFMLRPGSDPEVIRIDLSDLKGAHFEENGKLSANACGGLLTIGRPVIYQETSTGREEVMGGFVRRSDGSAGFQVAAYRRARMLVIDPVISFANRLGGSGDTFGRSVGTDSQGNVYIAGTTAAPDIATGNSGLSSYRGDTDAFVAKLSPDGDRIIYWTYIGGSGRDTGRAIAVTPDGQVYLAGDTSSDNFPVVNGVQPRRAGSADAFLVKIAADGASLIWATYFGGRDCDSANAVVADSQGRVSAAGTTASADFPLTNPLAVQGAGGSRDAFVFTMSATGSTVFSTRWGGSAGDEASSMTADAAGNLYVAGSSFSTDVPVTRRFQAASATGSQDAFLLKLSGARTADFAVLFGGSDADRAMAVAVDADNSILIGGETWSEDFPSAGPLQASNQGGGDGFLVRIAADGNALTGSTYLGGSGNDFITSVSALGGSVYAGGSTASMNFPLLGSNRTGDGFGDVFSTVIDGRLSSLKSSVVAGGARQDLAWSLGQTAGDTQLLAGVTTSADFPVAGLSRPWSGSSLLVMKIRDAAGSPDKLTSVSAASGSGLRAAPDSAVTLFGEQLADGVAVTPSLTLPPTLLSTTVTVTDSGGASLPAGLLYVSPGQVNFVLPPSTRGGRATVTVRKAGTVIASTPIAVSPTAPALFSADSSGKGVAAAVVTRLRGTAATFELAFECTPSGCTGTPIDFGPASDDVYLTLYGTGIRQVASSADVVVQMADVVLPVLFAGAQPTYPGLDQINLRLPRSLAGRGVMPVTVLVGGIRTNRVSLTIR